MIEENKVEVKLEINKRNISQTEEKASTINEALGKLYREINDYKNVITIPLSEEAIADASTSTAILIDEINDLKGDYQQLIQNSLNISSYILASASFKAYIERLASRVVS